MRLLNHKGEGNEDGEDDHLEDGSPKAPEEPAAEQVGDVNGISILNEDASVLSQDLGGLRGESWSVETVDVVTVARVRVAVSVDAHSDQECRVEHHRDAEHTEESDLEILRGCGRVQLRLDKGRRGLSYRSSSGPWLAHSALLHHTF